MGEIGPVVSTLTSIAALRGTLGTALPDLIILDIMLPACSGLDVCRTLNSDAATRDIPVLMMSALAKAHAADDFIAKPFAIDDFTTKVQQRLAD